MIAAGLTPDYLSPAEVAARCPYYTRYVPRDPQGNLEFRRRILRWGSSSDSAADALWYMCSVDIIFYVNTFCWTFNPRDYSEQPHRPFITWPMQNDALLKICQAIEERRDVVAPKSRQLGMTWICLLPIEWRWHFRPGQSFLLVSRIADDVDKPKRPKSLFWKLDYMHARQPRWLLPTNRWLGDGDPNRQKFQLTNFDNDSSIAGSATVEDLGRGDVLTAILLDEAASMEKANDIAKATRNATKTRIWNSTPKGKVGKGKEFYRQSNNKANAQIRLHWRQHPEKAAGLYYVRGGDVIVVDPVNNPLPDGYLARLGTIHDELKQRGFPIEGMFRSPYYDGECQRATGPDEIRQEEDIDFLSEGVNYFEPSTLEKAREFCKPPLHRGILDYDPETLVGKWEESSQGTWKLWVSLDKRGKPSLRNYIIGGDISGGVGVSDSSLIVIDEDTGEHCATFAFNWIKPDAFARLAVAACKFFRRVNGDPAKFNWETNGSGGSEFTDWIVNRIKYRHVYYRESLTEVSGKRTMKPGWGSTNETKAKLLGDLRSATKSGDFMPREEEMVTEMGQYIVEDDKINHSAVRDEDSDGDSHGDRVIAAGVAWIMRPNRAVRRSKDHSPPAIAPPGSIAWRREQQKKVKRLTA